MSGPMAEGGPLPSVNPERIAEHEQRLADWRREIEEERAEDETLERLRDGIGEV